MYLSNGWVPPAHLHLHNHILTLYKRKAYFSQIPNPSSGNLKYRFRCQGNEWLSLSHNQSFPSSGGFVRRALQGGGEHSHIGAREASEGIEAQAGVLHQYRSLHLKHKEI